MYLRRGSKGTVGKEKNRWRRLIQGFLLCPPYLLSTRGILIKFYVSEIISHNQKFNNDNNVYKLEISSIIQLKFINKINCNNK
jgi:hypothetical protein